MSQQYVRFRDKGAAYSVLERMRRAFAARGTPLDPKSYRVEGSTLYTHGIPRVAIEKSISVAGIRNGQYSFQ